MPKPNLSKILSANVIQSPQDDERFGLDWTKVKLGETVIQLDTKEVFIVINLDELDNPAGYLNITASALGVTDVIGTSGEIVVTMSGTQATLSLDDALVFTGKTVAGGTFNTPIINTPNVTGGLFIGGTFNNSIIGTPTVTGGTFTGGTFNTPSLVGAVGSLNNPTVTNGTFNGPTINNAIMVAPALGTPVSGVATNLTGTALGLTAGNALVANTVVTNANLTGDVTSIGNATTLATVNGAPGTFGSASLIPIITVNAKGLVTLITTVAMGAAAAGSLTGTTLAANVVNASLNNITPAGGSLAVTGNFSASGYGAIGRATSSTWGWLVQAPSALNLGGAFIENSGQNSISFLLNRSGHNAIVSDFFSGSTYVPLWLSGRGEQPDLVLGTNGSVTVGGVLVVNGGMSIASTIVVTMPTGGESYRSASLTGVGTFMRFATNVGTRGIIGHADQVFSGGSSNDFAVDAPGGILRLGSGGNAIIAVSTTAVTFAVGMSTLGSVTTSGNFNVLATIGTNGFSLSTTGNTLRWINRLVNAETGSNNGSDWVLNPRDDAGGSLGDAMTIKRSTGLVTLGGSLSVTSAISLGGNINATGSISVMSGGVVLAGSPVNPYVQLTDTGGASYVEVSGGILRLVPRAGQSAAITTSVAIGGSITAGRFAQFTDTVNPYVRLQKTNTTARSIDLNGGDNFSVTWSLGGSPGANLVFTPTGDLTVSGAIVAGARFISTTSASGSILPAGSGEVFVNSIFGLMMGGYGSTNDFTLTNRAGDVVLQNPGNTRNLSTGGNLTVTGGISVNYSYPNTGLVMTSNSVSAHTSIGFTNPNGVVGSINTSASTTSYNTTSDARLKENVRDFTGDDSGRLIDGLRPRWFDWKSGEIGHVGFLAQEENEVDPLFARIGAVTAGDADPFEIKDRWLRSDMPLVPILVAELKSVRTRLQLLEATGRN